MRKKVVTVVVAAALAAAQVSVAAAATSPNTGAVVSGDDDSDLGESVKREQDKLAAMAGGSSTSAQNAATGVSATGDVVSVNQGQAAGGGTVQTNDRGQAVIGNTAVEFVKGASDQTVGLPSNVVSTINGINSGAALNSVGTGIDLNGYNALVGTNAVMTKDAQTNAETQGAVELPLYIPNLVDGLGTVQVLYYDNHTGQWQLINPNRIDTASKTLWVTVPGSGTLSVVYKK